jgi:hypothetical protein
MPARTGHYGGFSGWPGWKQENASGDIDPARQLHILVNQH